MYQQQELAKGIPGAAHVLVPGVGHALMYEKPAAFATLVLGFINTDANIQTVS